MCNYCLTVDSFNFSPKCEPIGAAAVVIVMVVIIAALLANWCICVEKLSSTASPHSPIRIHLMIPAPTTTTYIQCQPDFNSMQTQFSIQLKSVWHCVYNVFLIVLGNFSAYSKI